MLSVFLKVQNFGDPMLRLSEIGIVCGIFLVGCWVVNLVSAREWKSANGKFTIEADFVAVKDGKVVLEKPDGTYSAVPLEKLSDEDQAFVKSQGGVSDAEDETEKTTDRPGMVPQIKLRGEKADDPPGEARSFPDLGWGVKSLDFSPNGGLLAAGKNDRAVLIFDVSEGARKTIVPDLEQLGDVEVVAFTPDGKKLLAGGYKGLIMIWNVTKTGQLDPAGQFAGHSKSVTSIAISPDGKFVLSGDEKRVRYWQLDNGKEVSAFEGFRRKVQACRISPDGRTGWATDGNSLITINFKTEKTLSNQISKSSGQFSTISLDGSLLATGDSYDVRLWDIKNNRELGVLEEREIQWSGAFTPDNKRLITGGAGKVNVWDLKRKSRIAAQATKGSYYVQCLAASPDNWHMAAIPGSAGQTLQVFRMPKD